MIKIKILDILDKKERNLNWLSTNACITYSTLYNFAHQKTASVTYDVLEKVCKTLRCDVYDIIEYIPEGVDILPESELEMLENTLDVLTNKKYKNETISNDDFNFLYHLLIKITQHRFRLNKQEYDRFYKAYIISLKLLPKELSEQILRFFVSTIKND